MWKVGGGSAGSRDATGVRGEGEEIEGGDVEREEMGVGGWQWGVETVSTLVRKEQRCKRDYLE